MLEIYLFVLILLNISFDETVEALDEECFTQFQENV